MNRSSIYHFEAKIFKSHLCSLHAPIPVSLRARDNDDKAIEDDEPRTKQVSMRRERLPVKKSPPEAVV